MLNETLQFLETYVAHPRNTEGHRQTLREHLDNVALISSEFAAQFGRAEYARAIGLAHDLGKTRSLWQERILQIEAGQKPKFVELLHDHKMSGAALVYQQDAIAALIIAGHHQGLPDFGKMKSEIESGKWEALKQEVVERVGTLEFPKRHAQRCAYFDLMMLYSCLVDADAIDTSAHAGERLEVRTTFATMSEMHSKLLAASVPNTASTAVQAMRTQVRTACLAAMEKDKGFFNLHAPTGSGKTISGGLWATGHACTHGLRRIVYVAPFRTIIDQTADIYSAIFGEDNVLAHHSTADFWTGGSETKRVSALSSLKQQTQPSKSRLCCDALGEDAAPTG